MKLPRFTINNFKFESVLDSDHIASGRRTRLYQLTYQGELVGSVRLGWFPNKTNIKRTYSAVLDLSPNSNLPGYITMIGRHSYNLFDALWQIVDALEEYYE